MSTKKDLQWLDKLISRTINTEKPQFDGEEWKQKYRDEFQTLLSRAAKRSTSQQPSIWAIAFNRPITAFAAAAVLVMGLATGGLMGLDTWQSPDMRSAGDSQMAQVEPTAIYNLDYLTGTPKGSAAAAYLTLVSAANGKER